MKIKVKKIMVILLTMTMLLHSALPILSLANESTANIKFEDINLYNAICSVLSDKILNKDDMTLTIQIEQEKLASITTLILKNKSIENLIGIDKFPSLVYLDLSGNNLTEESNLETLSNLPNLEELDLSSNKIRNLEGIESLYFDGINKFIIQNQEFMDVQIVGFDSSKQETKKTVNLAQIIKYINEDDVETIQKFLPRDGEEEDTYYPYPDETTTLTVEAGHIDSNYKYTLDTGRIKILYNVISDDFYRTKIDNRLIIIDSYNETGIIFKDKNLYKAVKEQLTKGQEINTVLQECTGDKDLYECAYDEELVLVISKEDLYNNITHLILDNRQIKDLTGIEEFVALSESIDPELSAQEMKYKELLAEYENMQAEYTNLILDLSRNYITDVAQLKTLMDNKVKIEQEIIANLTERIAIIATLNRTLESYKNEQKALLGSEEDETIGEIQSQRNAIYAYVKQQKQLQNDDQELKNLTDTIILAELQTDEGISNIILDMGATETQDLVNMLKALKTKLARSEELEGLIAKTKALIIEKVDSTYRRYHNLPELLELLTDDLMSLTNEDIANMDFVTAKNHVITNLNILKSNYKILTSGEKAVYATNGNCRFASEEDIDAIIQNINSITSDEYGDNISSIKLMVKSLQDNQKLAIEEIRAIFEEIEVPGEDPEDPTTSDSYILITEMEEKIKKYILYDAPTQFLQNANENDIAEEIIYKLTSINNHYEINYDEKTGLSSALSEIGSTIYNEAMIPDLITQLGEISGETEEDVIETTSYMLKVANDQFIKLLDEEVIKEILEIYDQAITASDLANTEIEEISEISEQDAQDMLNQVSTISQGVINLLGGLQEPQTRSITPTPGNRFNIPVNNISNANNLASELEEIKDSDLSSDIELYTRKDILQQPKDKVLALHSEIQDILELLETEEIDDSETPTEQASANKVEDKLIIAKRLEQAKLYKVKLKEVNAINLSENNISDLSSLISIGNLKYLDLNTNLIMDISNLAGSELANNLIYLDLSNNDARTIEALQDFSSLKYLNLKRNYIVQEEVNKLNFAKLYNLQMLNLGLNQIEDISNIINQLKKLDAFSRDEDGKRISEEEVIERIFNAGNVDLSSQMLTLKLSVEKGDSNIRIELPKIFRQVEQYQPTEVSFISGTTLLAPITLQQGTITIVRNEVGTFQKVIAINGGIASGTTCLVEIVVKEENGEGNNPGETIAVTGITLDKQNIVIVEGGNIKVNATITPTNASNKTITWTSSNENIATVKNGTITGNNVGNATITATTEDGNFSATCQVTVKELVYSIDDENMYVFNISPNTDAQTFKTKFSSEYNFELLDKEGNTLDINTDVIGTGMKIRLSNGEEFTLVVKGDVTGDGLLKGNDSTTIRLYRASAAQLGGAYLKAADVNNDGKVNGVDSTLIMLHIAGVSGYIL